MPEGTTLERTHEAAAALTRRLIRLNEVTHVATYAGTSSLMDFNGLVRHYYLRDAPHMADLRVHLIEKAHRPSQSHILGLSVRDELHAIARAHGANIKIVEMPPGPPVISTLTVEIYGEPWSSYDELEAAALVVAERFSREPGVVDIDTTVEARQTRYVFEADKEKAALAGLSTADLAHTLSVALGGKAVTTLHDPQRVNPTPIRLRLPRDDRTGIDRLSNLYLATADGSMIQLGELGRFVPTTRDGTIYHKNLRPVAYVFAEMAGRPPALAVIDMQGDLRPGGPTGDDANAPIPPGFTVAWAGEGEWKITLDVFRDLGIAFAAACLGIYILLVYETGSYFMPLVLMISIPLTIIGIIPGFWLLNLLFSQSVGGYHAPVYFTATGMIGMIALSGIAVRNAILLIDFTHAGVRRGQPLYDAILDAGAVRFRPIFLTAGTAMLAAIPIAFDPIFSGLAWALIFGLLVSTAFTLVVIPVIYWMLYGGKTA